MMAWVQQRVRAEGRDARNLVAFHVQLPLTGYLPSPPFLDPSLSEYFDFFHIYFGSHNGKSYVRKFGLIRSRMSIVLSN